MQALSQIVFYQQYQIGVSHNY